MNTGVYIFDYATAGPDYPSGVNNYWFIQQGAQYAKASYDKKNYIKGRVHSNPKRETRKTIRCWGI